MIAALCENELAEAGAVYAASWQEAHRAFCSPEFIAARTPALMTDELRRRQNEGWYLYALRQDEQLMGTVAIHPASGEIGLLYVLPGQQHRGFGRSLLAFAVSALRPAVTPRLSVLSNSVRAIRLYERFGFRPSGQSRLLSAERGIRELDYVLASAKNQE